MENMPFDQRIKTLSKISKTIASDLYLKAILPLMVVVTAETRGKKRIGFKIF